MIHTKTSRPTHTPTLFFFFNDTATTEIYTLSLHDALPISRRSRTPPRGPARPPSSYTSSRDRKSTRLNSSHRTTSYAVCCLKKKKKNRDMLIDQEDTNNEAEEFLYSAIG